MRGASEHWPAQKADWGFSKTCMPLGLGIQNPSVTSGSAVSMERQGKARLYSAEEGRREDAPMASYRDMCLFHWGMQ